MSQKRRLSGRGVALVFILSLLVIALVGVSNAQAEPLAATYTGCTYPGDQTDIPQVECEALVALYDGTTGASWYSNTGWKTTNTPCTWYGITCTTGNVTTLDLTNNNLASSIPSQLGNLSNLTNLVLNFNGLTGTIPIELGNLTNLTQLWLSNNSLTGGIPTQLGNLTNLLIFNLSQNNLSGSIPTELSNLVNLGHLRLGSNSLTGGIPSELGNLSNLEVLGLSGNSLTGGIPTQLGNLTNLQGIYLSDNSLGGIVPTELGNLTNLIDLYIQNNTSLAGWLPASLTNLTSLFTFEFNGTSLCEPPDSSFQTWLSSVTDLSSSNIICGGLPTDFDGDGDRMSQSSVHLMGVGTHQPQDFLPLMGPQEISLSRKIMMGMEIQTSQFSVHLMADGTSTVVVIRDMALPVISPCPATMMEMGMLTSPFTGPATAGGTLKTKAKQPMGSLEISRYLEIMTGMGIVT